MNYVLLTGSGLLFVMVLFFRPPNKRKEILITSVTLLFLIFYSIFFLVADYFTGKGVDASVVYHLRYGLQGAGFGEYWLLIITGSIGVVSAFILTFFIFRRLSRAGTNRKAKFQSVVLYILLVVPFLIHPATTGLVDYFSGGLKLFTSLPEGEFYQYYRVPRLTPLAGKARKNLVYIYAESLERTYFDESIFPGLADGLKEFESNSTSLTNIRQVYGTEWTIAGITASLCGIPLVTPSHGNSMSGLYEFLPEIKCLSDLLAERGYQLGYLSGSSLSFAGTQKFFETHGFDTVMGLEALSEQVPVDAYENGWGYYDDVLMDIALDDLNELQASGEQFAYFISTMDTHHPGENLSPSCTGKPYQDGRNSILNAVACADLVLGRFIDRLLASELAENTVIVLSSDHLAMRNAATGLLNQSERTNLLVIKEPGKPGEVIDQLGSALDVTPTLAPSLGFDGAMGLGRNLRQEESLLVSMPEFERKLQSWAPDISEFWGFPTVSVMDKVVIRPDRNAVRVAGRNYAFPILLEIGEGMKTTVRFESDQKGYQLSDYFDRLEAGTPFLLVHNCRSTRAIELAHWGYETCVMYGRALTPGVTQSVIKDRETIRIGSILQNENSHIRRRSADHVQQNAQDSNRLIAHAGGEIDGHRYTNTLQALDHQYSNGFRLFELDIIKTSDGTYVAAHDWDHWQTLTKFEGNLPPSRGVFMEQKILGRYTPLDMESINAWFERHPDAILVTDKINSPLAFSNQFVDRNRLMMELFTLDAVREGIRAGIRSSMPSWDMLSSIGNNKTEILLKLGVKDVVASRRIIKSNINLLSEFRDKGINVYVFHVNNGPNSDERQVICDDLDYVYGLYADTHDFSADLICTDIRP